MYMCVCVFLSTQLGEDAGEEEEEEEERRREGGSDVDQADGNGLSATLKVASSEPDRPFFGAQLEERLACS